MKLQIKKNKKQRILFQKFEIKQLILKSIISNNYFSKNIRQRIKQNYFLLDLNSSLTRIKNRCVLTGRSRSINRFFKLSRIQLRLLASSCLLPGVNKYSW